MNALVRLRVVFKDACILRRSQRLRGLQRCWLHLPPDIVTIADLTTYLLETFDLSRSCPHGIIISVDGFILPSFESACLLKDEDMILIKKNGVMFEDIVKLCGNQNQEGLQSRQISTFNDKNLAIMVPQKDAHDENKTVLFSRNTIHNDTQSEKVDEQCKVKRSKKLHGAFNTSRSPGDEENVGVHGIIAHKETITNETAKKKSKKKYSNKLQIFDTSPIKERNSGDEENVGIHGILAHKETASNELANEKNKKKYSHRLQILDSTTLNKKRDSRESPSDEENVSVHGIIAQKETTLNEMANEESQKKYSNELQIFDTSPNKDSQADSQIDRDELILPILHKEIFSEMINAKRKRKHFVELQGANDTLTAELSHGNSDRNEDGDGFHGNIAHKEDASNEMMNSKNTLSIMNCHGDGGNLGLPIGKTTHKETLCELKNAKCKGKHFNKHHGSDNALAVRDSQGDLRDVVESLPNGNIASFETPSEMMNALKRKYSNKDQAPSRSALRKKVKKLWRRINAPKIEKELVKFQIPKDDNQKNTSEHANVDQIVDEGGIVPVIVRPGHIRFVSSDTCVVQTDESVETFQWNRTTSKKKGQKWGKEKTSKKWNDDASNSLCNEESFNAMQTEKAGVSNKKSSINVMEAYKEPISYQVLPVHESSGNPVAKELEAVKLQIDFESFLPLGRLPKEGDVLIYRVVELSSSLCPELSPLRVGKVSLYDCSSSKVILLPLPEYPFVSEEIEGRESCSLYNEDGTLEVDFASLVDVRLFKPHESREITPKTISKKEMQNDVAFNNQEMRNVAPVVYQESASRCNKVEISSNLTVNDPLKESWEAINQALIERKAQLQKQNDFDEANSCSTTNTTPGLWSYRALRRNALGPTLAMLRGCNADAGM